MSKMLTACGGKLKLASNANVNIHTGDNGRSWIVEAGETKLVFQDKFLREDIALRALSYLLANERGAELQADWKSMSQDELAQVRFKNIPWKQEFLNFYGKRIPIPRLTSWHGDEDANYSYSGIKSKPNPWNEGLLYLRRQIEDFSEENFNSVLLNWYRGSSDSVAWHSDDEKELGYNPTIASLSLGATRSFLLRPKGRNGETQLEFHLSSGSLLIMSGSCQQEWEHSVPKQTTTQNSSRVNLTFRHILT